MAIHHIVAVRDSALDAYLPPFTVPALGLAIRSFQDELNSKDSPIAKHPGDYTLHCLGTFDTDTGVIAPSAGEQLARAKDFVVG